MYPARAIFLGDVFLMKNLFEKESLDTLALLIIVVIALGMAIYHILTGWVM
jgi:hypothetical protein